MTDHRVTTLWHGRFEGGPADELLAFTVSLAFDRRLAADDIAGSRAHVRGPGRGPASSPTTRPTVVLAALDRVEDELRGGHVRLRCRPTRTSTPPSSAGSPSSPAPAGAKLHTGRSRNDQVATDLRLFDQAGAGRRSPAGSLALQAGAARPGRPRPATPTCPATRTCSGPSPCCWPTTCWPTAGRWPATSTACSTPGAALDVSPLGAGALAGSSLPLDPDAHGRRPRLRRRLREHPRRRERPRLRGRGAVRPRPARRPPLAGSARRSCCGRPTSSASSASTTPTPPARSMLPQKKNPDIAELARGKAGRLHRPPHRPADHAEGPAARLQPRPAGGQGAAVRRRRPGAPRPSAP